MSKIVVQISFYENKYRSFPTKVRIGSVDNVTIGLNSTISAHPIVTGDMIADHMFKDPSSITITGKISTHGDSYSVVLGANSLNRSIAQMQEMFEKVKNEGILCKVSKIDLDIGDQTPKFIKRENMVLSSIEWTEDIDDLKFSFTFTEVLTAKITVEQVDTTNPLLPVVSDLTQTNFTDVFLDYEDVTAAVFYAYYEKGWITEDFAASAAKEFDLRLGNLDVNDIITTSAVGVVIYKIWRTPLTLKQKLVGTVATVLVLGAYRLAKTIADYFERKKYRVQLFEDWEKDGQRFADAVSLINKDVAKFNDSISVYQLHNSNSSQVAYGNINGEYYKFQLDEILDKKYFEGISYRDKNGEWVTQEGEWKTIRSYSLRVFDMQDTQVGYLANIRTGSLSLDTLYSYHDVLFKTKSGRDVYLVFYKTEDRLGDIYSELSLDDFAILSTSIKLVEFNHLLNETILDAFRG